MATLLLVDDSPALRKIVLRVLRAARLDVDHVFEAASVDEALELVRGETRFDAILCDVELPGRDGAELVRAVRGDLSPETLPIVMLAHEAAQAQRALVCGANACLCKPFTPQELRDVLAPWVDALEYGSQERL